MKVFLTQLRPYGHDFGKNLDLIKRQIDKARLEFSSEDILLLPELFGCDSDKTLYENSVSELARNLPLHLVSGSHHEERGSGRVNCGFVVDPTGEILSRYEKLRPYGIESKLGVVPGKLAGQFDIDGCRVLVLICADFWYSEVFLSQLNPRPDLILVPTFSISSRAAPLAARSLWRSMAVSRAYEFSAYVGISDWAYPCQYHALKSSSVAGLADPRPRHHDGFFSELGRSPIQGFAIDIPRIRALRQHRSNHAFLSDETLTGNFSNASKPDATRKKRRPGNQRGA